jgi:hypothetical protein
MAGATTGHDEWNWSTNIITPYVLARRKSRSVPFS